MNSERWQHVKQLMDAVIALAPAERLSYLDTACNGDSDIRREVDSLLAAHDQAGTAFMKNAAVDLQSVRAATAQTGRRVGVYELVEEIGHGGMGEVYRAVRVDGTYTKEVAVKLVRGGFGSGFLRERFRNERQILASLEHPNIARLLDGGTTEDGISYLVMELIEGAPIDSYCDAHQLSITERLKLFRQVCVAVQFAHQRLVIHRDIKPSNILVTKDGVPKLLDFGIAKILDPSGAGPVTTLAGPMTPAYASPEQIRGETITTATDVYSLGVVLYQLLTGRSPYSGETRSTLDLARAVCETDPGKPSTVVVKPQQPRAGRETDANMAEKASETREGSPLKLRRRLAGDLDNIVLMALRKEPARRYPSVEQFSEDIRRHLEARPVTATKGSWSYRAGKFIRRNKAGVAAAAVASIALTVGVSATLREARIAALNQKKAEKRFEDVSKLANSLMFEIHDSIQNLPGATPARKLLLDRAVEYLDRLSADAGGDVNLERELAWGYYRLANVQGDTSQSNLGDIHAADINNQKATALFEAVAKANPHSVTDQLNLAMAYRWRAFFDIYEKTGVAEIKRALAVTDPLMQTDGNRVELRAERADEEEILADALDAAGERMEAMESFRQVVELRKAIMATNPDYPEIRQLVAHSTTALAVIEGRFGSRDKAMQLVDTAINEFKALLVTNRDHPKFIRGLGTAESRRGEIELMRGDAAAARADFKQGLRTIEPLVKLDPANKTVQSDRWIAEFEDGRVLAASGRYAEALPVLQQALQGYQSLHLQADLGPGPAEMKAWIGEAQAGTHDWNGALKSYEDAAKDLAEDQDNYDDARCDLAMVETKIGATYLKMGKLDEASAAYAKALDIAKVPASLVHHDFPALNSAAEAYAGMGALAEARMRSARDTSLHSQFLSDARSAYEKSLETWKAIPYPSRITGNGYAVQDPQEIAGRMARLH